MRTHILICASLILSLALPSLAGSTRGDDIYRIQDAADIFKDIVDTPDSSFPLDIIQSAQSIAIIPGELHFAFFFGGQYGKVLVTCRVGHPWSAPAFVMISGGSFGLQFGGSATDLILIFRNRDGLKKLLSDKFKIGASMDLEMHAEILTYSRSRGIFAGISLDGSVFEPDQDADRAMYGQTVTQQQVLDGKVAAPQVAQNLLQEIKKYALS